MFCLFPAGDSVSTVRLRRTLHLHVAHTWRTSDLPSLQLLQVLAVCRRHAGEETLRHTNESFSSLFLSVLIRDVHNRGYVLQRVHLDIQVGEHANNYAEIAAKDKLTELQLRVRQLVEQADQIQKEQNYQRVSQKRPGAFLFLSETHEDPEHESELLVSQAL